MLKTHNGYTCEVVETDGRGDLRLAFRVGGSPLTHGYMTAAEAMAAAIYAADHHTFPRWNDNGSARYLSAI